MKSKNLPQSTEGELRCEVCSRRPLLARYGVDKRGKLYVHVKVYKQKRVYTELIITGGTVRIRCRECLRWYTITIRQPVAVDFGLEDLPESIPVF